jgi:hypothetical protein
VRIRRGRSRVSLACETYLWLRPDVALDYTKIIG